MPLSPSRPAHSNPGDVVTISALILFVVVAAMAMCCGCGSVEGTAHADGLPYREARCTWTTDPMTGKQSTTSWARFDVPGVDAAELARGTVVACTVAVGAETFGPSSMCFALEVQAQDGAAFAACRLSPTHPVESWSVRLYPAPVIR